MSPSPTLAHALLDAFLSPKAAFTALRTRPGWGWPAFALIAIGYVGAMYAFFAPMSPDWLVEQQMLHVGELPPGDNAAVLAHLREHAGRFAVLASVMSVLWLALLMPLLALFYFLGNRIGVGERFSFGAWIRFATWTQLPILVYAFGLLVIALTASQPDQPLALANYASMNRLLFGLSPGHPHHGWSDQLNLFYLWSIVLATIGIRAWTQVGLARALVIAASPFALVFGLWALLS